MTDDRRAARRRQIRSEIRRGQTRSEARRSQARSEARRNQTRSERLRARKAARERRLLTIALYVFAAIVTFAALAGASFLADRIVGHKGKTAERGYVALLTVGVGETGRQPISYLVVNNHILGHPLVFAVSRTLLLTGKAQEYVMAGDAMTQHDLANDMSRLIAAPIDFEVNLSYADFVKLLPPGALPVIVAEPASLTVNGSLQTYKNRFALPAADLPVVLSANGKSGVDEATMQVSVFRSLLQTAALQPQAMRAALVKAAAADLSKTARGKAANLLTDLLAGNVPVTMVPASGNVAEGQFAYRPDHQQIMAQITRRTPAFFGRYTVIIRNGTGALGIGDLVAHRLVTLNVNLASPTNADSFDYKQTRIITGSRAVSLGEDIRAILGRGVILNGASLSATTVVVIIGSDISAKDLQ